MNKEWIFACIVIAVLLFLSIAAYVRHLHHKKAKAGVRGRSDTRKLQEINEALRPFGFSYDVERDIFYSLKDAWQRKTGYMKLYDEMAPVMNMVIDCEPIYFSYDGRRWLIELWKGQYGVTSGAEVGIYVEEKQADEKREGRKEEKEEEKEAEEVFYQAVSEEEELRLSMALYKEGEAMFRRDSRHWWLTGFRLGEFSEPYELALRVSVLFPDREMQRAFLEGCYQAGYRTEDIYVRYLGVTLNFVRPRTVQPALFGKWHRRFVQWQNRCNCRLYLHLTKSFDRTIDRLDYLMTEYPAVFRMITGLGRIGRLSDKAGRKARKYSRLSDEAGRKGRKPGWPKDENGSAPEWGDAEYKRQGFGWRR